MIHLTELTFYRVSTPPPLDITPALIGTVRNLHCAHAGCPVDAVVTLGWDQLVAHFCAAHAEDRAGRHDAKILWVHENCGVCRVCHRVVPAANLGGHFNVVGEPCADLPTPR